MGVDVPDGETESVRQVGRRRGFAALTLGAVGVVFGDIGTSPLYALREALAHARPVGTEHTAVLGVVSLILWALVLIVTVKYIAILMRADNKGEGGPVALMTLARRASGRRTASLFALGVVGVALFYGDGVITPAFSVISAVEGLQAAPSMPPVMGRWVLPISAGILIGLFLAQARGTHRISTLFGPIMAVWFVTLGALGLWNLRGDLAILGAINPAYGLRFLVENGFIGFVILGSVFLAVTGAEALYADMGHFGKRPIRTAWFFLVFPCLALNYLGQGALVLAHPEVRHNPFFAMAPHVIYWPVLGLATAAAVIASQAVISGAFSMTQQAVQLGLLPRLDIKRTSETQTGQIFVPAVNGLMMVGVLLLLVVFQSSHRLASAYGVAVTGTMFINTLLAYVVARHLWKWQTVAGGGGAAADLLHRLCLPGVEPAEGGRGRLAAAGLRRGAGGGDVDLGAGRAHPHRQDSRGQRAADRPRHLPDRAAAVPRAGNGDVPDRQPRPRPARPPAQPQAQQGASPEQRDRDGGDGGDA